MPLHFLKEKHLLTLNFFKESLPIVFRELPVQAYLGSFLALVGVLSGW